MKKQTLSSPLIIVSSLVVAVALILVSLFSSSLGFKKEVHADTLESVSGYAWSSNIGWISFNGSNYGVNYDPSTGDLSGYAWADPHDDTDNSDNIGWISFNSSDTTGCPNAPCQAQVTSNGQVVGWAKVLSMYNEQAANSTPDQNSEGWISLSGSASGGGTYGVTYSSSTGSFSGYAYEPSVLGWISLSGSTSNGSGPATYGVATDVCTAADFTESTTACVNNSQTISYTKNPGDMCTGGYTPPAPASSQCGTG